jgi:hypothetical protein
MHYCISTTGFLKKQGQKNKSYKTRWFVLKDGMFLYYKEASEWSSKPQGALSLSYANVYRYGDAHSLAFEIITAENRQYLLEVSCIA